MDTCNIWFPERFFLIKSTLHTPPGIKLSFCAILYDESKLVFHVHSFETLLYLMVAGISLPLCKHPSWLVHPICPKSCADGGWDLAVTLQASFLTYAYDFFFFWIKVGTQSSSRHLFGTQIGNFITRDKLIRTANPLIIVGNICYFPVYCFTILYKVIRHIFLLSAESAVMLHAHFICVGPTVVLWFP